MRELDLTGCPVPSAQPRLVLCAVRVPKKKGSPVLLTARPMAIIHIWTCSWTPATPTTTTPPPSPRTAPPPPSLPPGPCAEVAGGRRSPLAPAWAWADKNQIRRGNQFGCCRQASGHCDHQVAATQCNLENVNGVEDLDFMRTPIPRKLGPSAFPVGGRIQCCTRPLTGLAHSAIQCPCVSCSEEALSKAGMTSLHLEHRDQASTRSLDGGGSFCPHKGFGIRGRASS